MRLSRCAYATVAVGVAVIGGLCDAVLSGGAGEEGDACAEHAQCAAGLYCTKAEECALCDDGGDAVCSMYGDSIDGSCHPCVAERPGSSSSGAPVLDGQQQLQQQQQQQQQQTLVKTQSGAQRGEVVEWNERQFSLKDDGMTILPQALTALQLIELNFVLDPLLDNLNATVAALDPSVLQRNAANLDRNRDAVDSHNGFCFGDIVQRGPGKYELRVPELDLYPPTPVQGSLPWIPPPPLFPPELQLNTQPAPPWREVVLSALGADAELRSATVILSTKAGLVTHEPASSQHWHSDGTLPPQEYSHLAYAVVVCTYL